MVNLWGIVSTLDVATCCTIFGRSLQEFHAGVVLCPCISPEEVVGSPLVLEVKEHPRCLLLCSFVSFSSFIYLKKYLQILLCRSFWSKACITLW